MPQLTSVVLKDGVLANHTFSPRGIANGVATLVNGTGVPVADKKVTASHTRTTTGREKIVLKLDLPIVQDVTVNGVTKPTPVRRAFFECSFSVDGTSSTAERADVLGYAWDLLGSAFVRDLVVDLGDLY